MMDDDKFMKSKLIEDCPFIMRTKKYKCEMYWNDNQLQEWWFS